MTKTNVQSIPSNSQHHDTPNSKTHVIKFRVTAEEKMSLELTCKLFFCNFFSLCCNVVFFFSSLTIAIRFNPLLVLQRV